MSERYDIRESPYTYRVEEFESVEDWLAIMDVEIRDVLRAINALPCRPRTLFSCAGYGRTGIHGGNGPKDHPADDPTAHFPDKDGYLTIYYGEVVCSLHDELVAVVDRVSDWTCARFFMDGRPAPSLEHGVATYEIGSMGDVDADMARKWAEVLRVVRAHACRPGDAMERAIAELFAGAAR